MDLLYELTIPANTAESATETLEVDLGVGVLVKCEVGFPIGPAGLVRARVRQGRTPRYPSNDGAWYHWDNYVFQTQDHLVLKKSDRLFILEGWSADDSFSYDITFRFVVLPQKIAESYLRQESSLRLLVNLLTPRRLKGAI